MCWVAGSSCGHSSQTTCVVSILNGREHSANSLLCCSHQSPERLVAVSGELPNQRCNQSDVTVKVWEGHPGPNQTTSLSCERSEHAVCCAHSPVEVSQSFSLQIRTLQIADPPQQGCGCLLQVPLVCYHILALVGVGALAGVTGAV